MVAVVGLASPGVRHALVLATSHQPQRFTELYFTDQGALPQTYRVGVLQRVAFTIRNREGQPVSHSYAVYADDSQLLEKVTPVVADQSVYSAVESIRIPDGGGRVKIEVRLLSTNQSIHYWVTKVPAT